MPRYLPDHVLLGFSSLPVAPGCPELRADFVRLALGVFAGKRRYERFEAVVRSAPLETLKGILLAVTDSDVENEDGFYNRAFKVAALAMHDKEFVRLVELASDVLDWDCDWETIERAWPILCDELEYELEEHDWMTDPPYEHRSGYTENEARNVQHNDRRWYARRHAHHRPRHAPRNNRRRLLPEGV